MRDGDEANDSEEACHIEDLTGAFDDPEAQFNATTLSRKTMLTMYTLHTEDPEKHSVEALALKYKVRRQRVSAILVTEGAEARFKADGGELPGNGVEIDDLVVRAAPAQCMWHPDSLHPLICAPCTAAGCVQVASHRGTEWDADRVV